jgi:hypothetical protein
MAVRAPDDASADLLPEALVRGFVHDQIGDVRGLLALMVELQHRRVHLPAVGAR